MSCDCGSHVTTDEWNVKLFIRNSDQNVAFGALVMAWWTYLLYTAHFWWLLFLHSAEPEKTIPKYFRDSGIQRRDLSQVYPGHRVIGMQMDLQTNNEENPEIVNHSRTNFGSLFGDSKLINFIRVNNYNISRFSQCADSSRNNVRQQIYRRRIQPLISLMHAKYVRTLEQPAMTIWKRWKINRINGCPVSVNADIHFVHSVCATIAWQN